MNLQTVDTVFIAVSGGARSVAADWALIVLGSAAALAMLVALVMLARIAGALSRLARASRDWQGKADPLLERGKAVAANLEFVTTVVRRDVESLTAGIRAVSDRLTEASGAMEERIADFNALLEVVQGEAEEAFLETASTAHGIRAGASRLTGRGRDPDAADDEHRPVDAEPGRENDGPRSPEPDASGSA